jgi:hypothetical protein
MIDLEPIKARLQAATPGPWRWSMNTRSRDVRLDAEHSGRLIVMDFVRWGMQSAQPRFRTQPHDLMTEYSDCMPHPDAALIAHAPTDIADLVAEVERLRMALDTVGSAIYTQGRGTKVELSLLKFIREQLGRGEPSHGRCSEGDGK